MDYSFVDGNNWQNKLLLESVEIPEVNKEAVVRVIAGSSAFSMLLTSEQLEGMRDWAQELLDEGVG